MYKEKKWKKEREKNRQKQTVRDKEMLLDTDRDRNIDFLGKKVCRTHMAVGHRKGEGTAPSGSGPPLCVCI